MPDEHLGGAPVLTNDVIGAADEPMSRMIASSLEEGVRAAVRRAALSAYSAELRDALIAKAKAEVRAATPPPVQPETSLVDQLAIDALALRAKLIEKKTAKVEVAEVERDAQRSRLAAHPVPLRTGTRVIASLLVVFLAVGIASTIGLLLGISLDAFVVRPVIEDIYGDGTARIALTLSLWLGVLVANALLVPQAVIFVLAPRSIGIVAKAVLLVVDVAFALAFLYLRSGSGVTGQGLAFSLMEGGLSVVLTVVLFVTAVHFKADSDTRAQHLSIEGAVLAAERTLEERQADLAAENKLQQAQVLALEHRDVANRMLPRYEEVAAATVHAAYIVEMSALISETATAPSDQMIDDTVRSYITQQTRHLGLSNGHNRNGGENHGD